MRRALLIALLAGLMTAALAVPALAGQPDNTPPGRTQVYVTSQDMTYDSILLGTLPPHGRFQQLHVGPDGPYTEFGPGDPGYLGGRWWVDANDNGEMDEDDVYFLCPLIRKGHAT